MTFQTFLFLIAISLAHGAVDRDWSLEEMCTYHNGMYEISATKEHGAWCTFKMHVYTADGMEALRFCKDNFPYTILTAQAGTETSCKAEANLICRSGWVQMFGRCYKITKKLMTRADAKKHCENQADEDKKLIGASIAFLHRDALIARWKDYFSRVSRIWIDASEVFSENLEYDEGPNMLLAYEGWPYSVSNNDIIRVPDTEKAMVLCEYAPPMNQAQSNYLMRRYNEIYHPAIQTVEGVYTRSASSRIRDDTDKLADSKYCAGVLSPFLRSVGAQSALPTRDFVDALVDTKTGDLIRTSAYSKDATVNSRNNPSCTVSIAKNYGMDFLSDDNITIFRKIDPVWRANKPSEQCDGASWSTGLSLTRSPTDSGLEDMSDAQSAPIYCQTRFETQAYGGCPDGYTEYLRKNGQKWCHKFIPELMSIEDAEKKCGEAEGGFVSGFSDFEEMKLIDKLAGNSSAHFKTHQNIWLGARRRAECLKLGVEENGQTRAQPGFDVDETSPCSRLRVFEWINGVATNPPAFLDHWMKPTEPNYVKDGEKCVVLLKGMVTQWGPPELGDLKLNDVPCDSSHTHYPICGREAPIVVSKYIVN